MISLLLGRLDIDSGKNGYFLDHSPIFQSSDIATVPYEYVDNRYEASLDDEWKIIVEEKEAYKKRLLEVIDRISLLGYTESYCSLEFQKLLEIKSFEEVHLDYRDLKSAFSAADISDILPRPNNDSFASSHETDTLLENFFKRRIQPLLGRVESSLGEFHFEGETVQSLLKPYTLLHLFSANRAALPYFR